MDPDNLLLPVLLNVMVSSLSRYGFISTESDIFCGSDYRMYLRISSFTSFYLSPARVMSRLVRFYERIRYSRPSCWSLCCT